MELHMPHTQTTHPGTSTFPDIALLYDRLMAEIEPELTSVMIPELSKRYAQETKEEAKAREERYKKAFALFLPMWQSFLKEHNVFLQTLQKRAMKQFEKTELEEETVALQHLEESINNNL